MDGNSSIQKAQEIIGEGTWEDYIIAPTKHAKELEARAPALAKILRSSEVDTVARQYEEKDNVAIEAQSSFKKYVQQVNIAVFLSALIGTVLMASALLGKNNDSGFFQIWLILLGITCGILGALGKMWMSRVRGGRMLERWMTQRASAETHRLRYFNLVTRPRKNAQGASSIPLSLLQLEYFIRYQLEVQNSYYLNRGKDHRRAADGTLRLAGWSIFLGSLGACAGGVLGGVFNHNIAVIAACGMLGAALSSYVANNEAVNQDRRNAERYGRTFDTLQKLREKLDEIRKAVATGSQEALEAFVASVHEQLSLEHRQWISAASDISQALSKLDKALADTQ